MDIIAVMNIEKAKQVLEQSFTFGVSHIQRLMELSYHQASQLIDDLASQGIIIPTSVPWKYQISNTIEWNKGLENSFENLRNK